MPRSKLDKKIDKALKALDEMSEFITIENLSKIKDSCNNCESLVKRFNKQEIKEITSKFLECYDKLDAILRDMYA